MKSSVEPKYYGPFGGQYAPEILKEALDELEAVYRQAIGDKEFQDQLNYYYREYVGRPSLLYFSERLTRAWGGPKIYLKREDLNFTGAHKINNTVGQILLALRMGKKRIIAETGAGQHGVATATVCAHHGLECYIYMGEEDVRRQALNVYKMELMGAKVVPVTSGQGTLKDATSEAMRDWALNVRDTHYIIGSVVGPHPFPEMVADFHRVIGEEIKEQILAKEGRLPDLIAACVGGGSNAAGMFLPFIEDRETKILGVEAGGRGEATGDHAATLTGGSVGIFHSFKSLLLQNEEGQISPVHSISAGLDYPGVGPLHAWLHDSGRGVYLAASDDEAVEAFQELCRLEGIIPALESSHALAGVKKYIAANKPGEKEIFVINLSGRGDKDVVEVARYTGRNLEL